MPLVKLPEAHFDLCGDILPHNLRRILPYHFDRGYLTRAICVPPVKICAPVKKSTMEIDNLPKIFRYMPICLTNLFFYKMSWHVFIFCKTIPKLTLLELGASLKTRWWVVGRALTFRPIPTRETESKLFKIFT